MNRVVHFEIFAENPERAIHFYSSIFGWSFEKWEGASDEYWMLMTAPRGSAEAGINGGLLRRSTAVVASELGANAFVCTVEVEDFDMVAGKILATGGKVVTPKYALPKMAWQGYFLDTEGNSFGLHQADQNAA